MANPAQFALLLNYHVTKVTNMGKGNLGHLYGVNRYQIEKLRSYGIHLFRHFVLSFRDSLVYKLLSHLALHAISNICV